MKIGIVGLGLIGGSLALDLRALGLEVLGVSRQEKTCQIAEEKAIVHQASVNLSLLEQAEVVFICTPIEAIAPTLTQLISHLHPAAIVTDVGSVKAPIVKQCSQLWANFLGGHPMAGNANQGIEAATNNLFTGAPYVLTPQANTPPAAVAKVREIVAAIGSRVYFSTPEEHDRAVAWISHLPLIVSASLIDACMSEENSATLLLAQHLASSGFRDTSRVGGGNSELGLMIARYNRPELLRSLTQYRQSLDKLIHHIDQQNWQEVQETLDSTQQARSSFFR